MPFAFAKRKRSLQALFMNFQQKLENAIAKNNSLLCIGLDTDTSKISKDLFDFNKDIIDQTADLVCCYKINSAFYSAVGLQGLKALQKTITYIHDRYTGIPVILDAKRADIGNTSEQYVKEVFDVFDADAVTVNPYHGFDGVEPFLKRKEKGVIVLCRTSNKSASDFQDLLSNGEPLYMHVARKVAEWNKDYGNCMLVVGSRRPEELRQLRKVIPGMFFLVPGVGVQGGNLAATLRIGLTKEKSGLIIHAARSIIYASTGEDFANAARSEAEKLRDEINGYR